MSGIVVLTTTPNLSSAKKIAKVLVQKKLAGCVSVTREVWSCYRWRGAIETSREALLLIKTERRLFTRLERALLKIHPYEVPEILALPVAKGTKRYLRWLKQSVFPS